MQLSWGLHRNWQERFLLLLFLGTSTEDTSEWVLHRCPSEHSISTWLIVQRQNFILNQLGSPQKVKFASRNSNHKSINSKFQVPRRALPQLLCSDLAFLGVHRWWGSKYYTSKYFCTVIMITNYALWGHRNTPVILHLHKYFEVSKNSEYIISAL